MRKVFLILTAITVFARVAVAADDSKESFFAEKLDEAFSSFKKIISPYERLDPIVITPTRYSDALLDISSDVSVLDETQLTDGGKKYVPDTLRNESGITVSDLLGTGKSVRVDLRGFGDSAPSNVLVMIDGRRTNQIDMSGADWIQIDTGSIKTVEIVRGPGSVLYGDNATGGVINIITKDGKGKKPSLGLDYDMGSYRYSSWKGYAEGGTDFIDYYGMVSTTYNNGYRINNAIETVDYNANVTMKPAENFTLKSSASYHKDWYGMPGALKPADINSVGRRGSIYPNDRAKTEDYYYMLTPEAGADLALGRFDISGDAFFRSRRTSSIFYSPPLWDSANKHHIKTLGFTPKAAFTTELFGFKNRMLAGFDYYAARDEINSGLLSGMDSLVIDKDTAGIYVTDTLELPLPFIVECGGRAEWAYYKFDQQAVLTGKNEERPFEYACEAGVTYKYNDKSSLYARYSRSYRFPDTDEWYSSMYVDWFSGLIAGGLNTSLKPQTANNFEFGIKEHSSKYVNVNANYYIMPVRHEIYYDSVANQNTNYARTMHRGFELDVDLVVFDTIRAFINYTCQQAYFEGGSYAGHAIPMVPRNQISTGLKYTYMNCFEVVYNINYVGPRRFANDLQNSSPQLKEYMTNNIKFSYRKEGFEVHAAINNIFDAEYSEYGVLSGNRTPAYYPSPRLNASMGVRYRF